MDAVDGAADGADQRRATAERADLDRHGLGHAAGEIAEDAVLELAARADAAA